MNWHQTTQGGYNGEMAEVTEGNTKLPTCPKCHEKLGLDELRPVRDEEGELMYLQGVHSCGAALTIFND